MNNDRRFNHHLASLLVTFVFALLPQVAAAQPTLHFLYAAPTANLSASFGAAAITTRPDFATGYSFIEITAANRATFLRVATPNLIRTFNQMQSGTPFRNRLDQVLQISQGNVDEVYILVDDRTGISPAHTGWFASGDGPGGLTIVWPAANVFRVSEGKYLGRIALGEMAARSIQTWPGGWLAWEGVILHENFHTQFVGSETGGGGNEKSKWGSINITYGSDNQHFFEELLGEQSLTMEEGWGNFYGSVHNDPAGARNVLKFFNRSDDRYVLEARSVLAGDPALSRVPRRRAETLGDGTNIFWYRWLDIPGYHILFCETTAEAFHTFFYNHVNANRDQALTMINSSARQMWQWRDHVTRYPVNDVTNLSLLMEDFAATPEGTAAKTAGTLTSSMFPFALLDLLTHFGMTTDEYQREFRAGNPRRIPRAFTEYWNRRDEISTRVQPFLQPNHPCPADPGHPGAQPSTCYDIDGAVRSINAYFQQADTILISPRP
jgi:hypothetical protein